MEKQGYNNKDTIDKSDEIQNDKNQIEYLLGIFNEKFMIRRKSVDKQLFLEFSQKYFSQYGYRMIKYSKKKNINIYSNNIKNAKYIFTAHYDTSPNLFFTNISNKLSPFFGVYSSIVLLIIVMLLSIINPNPYIGLLFLLFLLLSLIIRRDNKNNVNDNTSGLISLFLLATTSSDNKDIAFILFDNEEKGLKGSKKFSKDCINLINKDAVIINLDCVGDGDTWCIYSNEKVLKNKLIENLKGVEIKKGILTSSDHKSFIDLRDTLYISRKFKSKFAGYYHKNIHTNLDININENDISELIDVLKRVIAGKY